jgi:beta-lactamase superfamily II metal-dependent hydrolase
MQDPLADGSVEVLKSHHGESQRHDQAFVDWLKPTSRHFRRKKQLRSSIAEAISMLQSAGSKIFRTDQKGDIRWFRTVPDQGIQTGKPLGMPLLTTGRNILEL